MDTIEQKIAYEFTDKTLLKEALTHPSYTKKLNQKAINYQRLEFLGDAVLGALISHLIYEMYPNEIEGDLAKRHAGLVSGVTIAEVASAIGLGDNIIMNASEAASGGKANPTILEDVCEALIGAIYLDGGFEEAKRFVFTHWHDLAASAKAPPKDAKTALQEWAQGRGKPLPVYKVVKNEGPAHAPLFTIEVSVEGVESVVAEGASKAKAEQKAATLLLETLRDEP